MSSNEMLPEDEEDMLPADEAAEEIPLDADHPMDSDPEDTEDQEIQLQNDSIAHFDHHTDSIYCVAAHPLDPSIIATGGGDDTAFVFSSSTPSPLLPPSYESNPEPVRKSLEPIAKLSGHTDSINAITFTLPAGAFLCTAGLDGRLRTHICPPPSSLTNGPYAFLTEVQEVEEINWLAPCPHPSYPNTLALGAQDGSVWIYTVDAAADPASALQLQQAYYLHTASCTAGAWSPDGKLLATVSEDGSLYVWDPFGEASSASQGSSQAVVSLTAEDQRFTVEGGLYSVAIAPTGAFVVVGGAEGNIRVVGLPRLSSTTLPNNNSKSQKPSARNKSGGKQSATAEAGASQAGQLLASLKAQSDGIETLAFSAPPLTLLAAGSVDGSILLLDTAHRFTARRHIQDAHEEHAVVQLAFVQPPSSSATATTTTGAGVGGWLLTSCGMDGVVRRWDTRGGTAARGQGLVREWKGHRGGGDGGGVIAFVQGGGRVVTAGDDGRALAMDSATNKLVISLLGIFKKMQRVHYKSSPGVFGEAHTKALPSQVSQMPLRQPRGPSSQIAGMVGFRADKPFPAPSRRNQFIHTSYQPTIFNGLGARRCAYRWYAVFHGQRVLGGGRVWGAGARSPKDFNTVDKEGSSSQEHEAGTTRDFDGFWRKSS